MDLLKEYFIRFLNNNVSLLGLFEFGVEGSRFDLMILHANKQHFRGFEFKRTRADFLRDLRSGKWVRYLDYCNTFTWVCPNELIYPDEIISPCGLLWIEEKKVTKCYDGTYVFQESEWKKIPRGLDLSQESFKKIVCLFIERIKFRKNDFY